jgi:NACHT domain
MGRGGPRRGHGRVGVWYLLLFVGTVAAALGLAGHFHLGAAAILAAVLPGLAPGYLGWAAFRADRAEAAAVDLEAVAGQLAVAVRNQWEDEAAVRRVNDPYPLPVAWRAAGDDLGEPWPLLHDLARAWPGGPPGDPAGWPQDASGLGGQDAEIGEVFSDRVPTRRLVILGEPGSGKSVLLIGLLQDLLERRTDSEPVPVLFTLASWNPDQPLKAWLADQLRRTYPGLVGPAPAAPTAAAPVDWAQALLDARLILPLLDGFDELPVAVHPAALDSLNRALPTRQPLILASRAAQYRNALTHPATVRLNGAAAIRLLPLTPDAAAAYLRRDAGGPHVPAASRWDTVTTHLGTGSPVGQALSTPLGLFLARTIYNPRPGTPLIPTATSPDELCDTTIFPDRTVIDTHLFNAYIPAAYTPHHPHPPRWTTEQATRTFAFLARFLENQRDGSPDLAWWHLPQAIPPRTRYLVAGLTGGFADGLVARLAFGLAYGLMGGLAGGLAGGGIGVRALPIPGFQFRWGLRMLVLGVGVGLAGGAALGLGVGLGVELVGGFADGLTIGLTIGPALGLTFGLTIGLTAELTAAEADLTSTTGPGALLSLDRRTFLASGLTHGLASGLIVGLPNVLAFGLTFGLAFGLVYGLAFGLAHTAWANFALARAYLAVRGKVPQNLMAFLEDAHGRGVLRQIGPVYQFRHIDLQRHLARQ